MIRMRMTDLQECFAALSQIAASTRNGRRSIAATRAVIQAIPLRAPSQ
jgi:hypothetical protein